MILFRLLTWPYVRKHVLRTALTTVGIVLGVAVFVGLRIANRSVLSAFSETVDRIAGKTELEIAAGDAGFNEDVLERVQGASCVDVAVPMVEAIVDSKLKGQGNLLVLGVDMTGDRSLREYDFDSEDGVISDPLVFLAQPDSIILSNEFADRNRTTVGSRVPLGTVEGTKEFTVRGIMKSSGLASAFGGNLAIMDIYAAQKMFGRGRTFDRIDMTVRSGATIAGCQQQLEALLGPAFQVRKPSGRGQQFEAMLTGYTTMVGISSAFALFIGMFIIYNSFGIAVTQRRSDIGILRALGATRGQIRWLFLGESAVLGLIGSIIGVAVGVGAARAVLSSIGGLIADVYGISQRAGDLAVSPLVLAGAVGLGIATSLLAAVVPSHNAARVDPVLALQKGKYQVLSAGEYRLRVTVAAVLSAVALSCLMVPSSRSVFYVGYAVVIVVALLLAPLLSMELARAIQPALKWLRPVEGALAADSLIQAPRRTSASVAALMLSLALVVAFGGMSAASYRSIIQWVNTTLDPDLFVTPSPSFGSETVRFPEAMGQEMAAVPGVERVQMIRNSRIMFRQIPIMAVAIEVESIAQTARPAAVAGNADEMYRRAAAEEGVIVSDNLAQLQRLAVGDIIEIPAPYGLIRLPVVGTVVDYSNQQGAIILDRKLYIKYWHDDSVNVFRLYVRRDADVLTVRERVLELFAGRRQVFVMTNEALRSYILKIAGRWFSLTSVQVAIAVLVAILGIVNTLTVSITDRRRELGVLRAVGAVRRQIRGTVWLEALSIGAVGLILGYGLGAVNLYYLLQIVQHDVTGMRLNYEFPVSTALVLIPTILGSAFVAALWPAEAAVRGPLVEALEYE